MPDETGLLTIEACCPWVDTGVDVVAGQTLWFEASGRWVDALIPCGPAGFRFNPLGFLGRRRSPRHNWFALIGGLDEDEATLFLIGRGGSHRFERSGRLSVFATTVDAPTATTRVASRFRSAQHSLSKLHNHRCRPKETSHENRLCRKRIPDH